MMTLYLIGGRIAVAMDVGYRFLNTIEIITLSESGEKFNVVEAETID